MTNTNPEARDVIADWLADHDVNPPRGKSINDLADTIIAALAAEGMVIVPRVATDEMVEAFGQSVNDRYSSHPPTDQASLEDIRRHAISAAIAAALPTPTLPPAGDER